MCLGVLPASICMRSTGVPGTHGGWKRVLNLPELELQMIVGCECWASSNCKSSWCSEALSCLPRLPHRFLRPWITPSL